MKRVLKIILMVFLSGLQVIVASLPITIMTGCGHNGSSVAVNAGVQENGTDADNYGITQDDDTAFVESLNDIRFNGWTDDDWEDNEYLRELRRYIDLYNSGKLEDKDLDDYRPFIKGKFLMVGICPALFGGVLINFIFVDHPKYELLAWVYSDVDDEERKVLNYWVRSVMYQDDNSDVFESKEEVYQYLHDNPSRILW